MSKKIPILIIFILFSLILIFIGIYKKEKDNSTEILTIGVICLMLTILVLFSGIITQTKLEEMVQSLFLGIL